MANDPPPPEPSLQKVLGPFGVFLLTVSALSPVVSFYIGGDAVLHMAGSGAAVAFLVGGVASAILALLYAEIGAAFPQAGGTYPSLAALLGPMTSFPYVVLTGAVSFASLAFTALGLGDYVRVLVPGLPLFPVAAGAMRAAIAADEPPDEPPGASGAVSFGRRHGEITLPKALVSFDDPMANWSRLSLPSMPAPASHNFCETVDSYCGLKPSRIFEAAVVWVPLVANRSFMPIGTPAILPRALPAARSASTLAAAARAASGVVTMKALSALAPSTAALNALATSVAVKSPWATPSRISARVRSV